MYFVCTVLHCNGNIILEKPLDFLHCVASRFGYPNYRWSQLVRIIDVLLYKKLSKRNDTELWNKILIIFNSRTLYAEDNRRIVQKMLQNKQNSPFFSPVMVILVASTTIRSVESFNPLNPELNPIRHLLALVGVRHIVHVSRVRVKQIVVNNMNKELYPTDTLAMC